MRFHPYFHAFAHGGGHREAGSIGGFGLFRRQGRPGGRPRMFEQGDLRLVVLKLISEKPSHGYEIIKAIEERFGGAYAPSPGVIYPTLTLLEEMGAIRVQETDGPRKLYAITPEGETALRQDQATVESVFDRMADIKARHGGGPAPQIVRAMENLKTALRLRLSRGPLSPEQLAEIAQVLDAAAKAVESS
jgi:DNA-binding PadR family transcriptional regulator